MLYKSIKFGLLAVSALGASGVVLAGGLPQGGVVQEGSADLKYAGGGGYISLDINQQSDKAVIDWKSFSVGKDNTVNFNQPSGNSATLNRVTGDFTSEIAGRINANGSVFLVNPNGILITADGVIDTGGFVASTLDIDNNDFLNGNYTFTKGVQNGVVANHGNISVDDGGFVALLGGAVKNDGTVRALVGRVGFAGGEKIVMSFGNNDFLRVEVPTDKWHTLTDSKGNKVSATLDLGGKMDSRGGFIDITVADASDILRQTISIDGVVSANTVSSTGGVISISGGTVGITSNGRITADAAYGNAGTITIDANTIDSSGMVAAVAQNGTGGMIKVALQQGANLNASTRFDVSGGTKGGSLSFIGGLGKQGTKVLGSADFKADSTDGKGGYIDISNKDGLVGLLSGTVSAAGKTQGGRIRLGGAFQGGGYNPKTSPLDKRTQDLFVARWGDNSSLVSAGKTSLGTGVQVDVSSESGTGGTAILWADNTTNNYAAIDATGATGGGAVEISGKKRVDSFGLKRVKADNGVILLDPKNVVIGKWGSALAQVKKIAHGVSLSGGGSVSLKNDDYFGSSASLSGNGAMLAVGAMHDSYVDPDNSANNKSKSGAVYLYSIGTISTWGDKIEQKQKITNGVGLAGNALDANDYFGVGVSLSDDGSKLAVGAFGDDTSSGGDKGAVYLFTTTDSWATVTQTQKIADGVDGLTGVHALATGEQFGYSVSLSNDGSKLAVGATDHDSGKGAVYLFTVGTNGNWGSSVVRKATIENGFKLTGNITLAISGKFGSGVSLSSDGSKLAVGAYNDDDGGTDKGAVYLFTVGTNGNWGASVALRIKIKNNVGGLASNALENGDYFGYSVSLSDDGSKLAVGAYGDDDGGTDKGAVYLFTISGDGNSWGNSVKQFLKLSDKADDTNQVRVSLSALDNFGSGVSLSGDGTKLAVGAILDDTGGSNRGAVYLINVPSDIVDASDLQTTLKGNTDFKIVASNDIIINESIDTLSDSDTNKDGKLTLIAGRSIKIEADVKINDGLVITANTTADTSGDNGGLRIAERDTGKAEITVATGKTISGGKDDLLIKMLKGSDSNPDNRRQTGAITVWKAEGNRVSIVHAGTTNTSSTPSDSEIVILENGHIETALASENGIGIELVADKFTNDSGSGALSVAGNSRYLVWTKSPSGNKMGKNDNSLIPVKDYSIQYSKSYNFNGGDFQSNGNQKSTFIYSSANPAAGGGGGGGGGGGAAIVLIGAGVAVVAMGGIGGGAATTGAAAAGAGAIGAGGAVVA